MIENGPSPRILLVDDDVELTAILGEYLTTEGFVVQAVQEGESAIGMAAGGTWDAILLDVMMPRMTGTEVLSRIRESNDIPIIMLTAKGDDLDRVAGLELGADDYIAKPFYPREVVARLRAVLRRKSGGLQLQRQRSALCFHNLTIDPDRRETRCGARLLDLTQSEFTLLRVLVEAREAVLSKDELSLQVLRRERQAYDRSVDVHVSNLRQKLAAGGARVGIDTVRGVGYRIAAS